MNKKTALVTGAYGLVGSAVVRNLIEYGWQILGLDNNMREKFFGSKANVGPMLFENSKLIGYEHIGADIRDREAVAHLLLVRQIDAIVHCAGQPSHDFSGQDPMLDWDVNATGTVNLLVESQKKFSPPIPFIFMSTNKVYGDRPNQIPMKELPTRYDYAEPGWEISEKCPIDQSLHSPFGVSKAAADLMVQEFGRYYGMPTVCLRAGCITGPAHAGVELHGFLSHLVKTAVQGGRYRVYGYKGKQLRDNVHADDVAQAIRQLLHNPITPGSVYNIGGGRENAISVIEAIVEMDMRLKQRRMDYEIRAQERKGDHIAYITDFRKLQEHCGWRPKKNLSQIFDELTEAASVTAS